MILEFLINPKPERGVSEANAYDVCVKELFALPIGSAYKNDALNVIRVGYPDEYYRAIRGTLRKDLAGFRVLDAVAAITRNYDEAFERGLWNP